MMEFTFQKKGQRHWIQDGDSLSACHSINYWIPFFSWSKRLIEEQFFPKIFVSRSIFIIEGVILISNSTNLEQKKKKNFNPQLILDNFSQKPKTRFSSKRKIFVYSNFMRRQLHLKNWKHVMLPYSYKTSKT